MKEEKKGREKLISVIIPVYDVENFLPRCLESVIKQTYCNLEIILVDDGSTDNSGCICDEYAKEDGRIITIHKKNEGVSVARNVALDIAKGQYIVFVDSDDVIEPDMIETLVNEMEDNIDIVECEYYEFSDDGKGVKNKGNNSFLSKTYKNSDKLIGFFDGTIKWAIWNKLYRVELLKNIRFNIAKTIGEDAEFIWSCCNNAKAIKEISYYGYGYYQRAGSAIHTKLTEKRFEIFELIEKIKEECKEQKEVFSYSIWCEYKNCKVFIRNILKDGRYKSALKKLRKKILINKRILYESKLLTRFDKCFIRALRFCPHILYGLIWLYVK